MPSWRLRQPVRAFAVVGIYVLLGALGPAWGEHPGALWAPSGVGLAVALVFGRAIWPAILAGAFLACLSNTGLLLASLGMAVANVAEAVLGAALVDRWAGGADAFRTPRSIVRYVGLMACLGIPLGATCGAAAMVSLGPWVWADAGVVWAVWWVAHLAGVLVVTPLVLLWIAGPLGTLGRHDLVEAGLLLGVLTLAGIVVFGGVLPPGSRNLPLESLCAPPLLWAAFRFGRRETAAAVAVLFAVAVWGTLQGYGPFARASAGGSLMLVQCYMGAMAVMSAVLSAALAEQRRADHKLQQLATTDPLTGLANYRRLLDVLRAEIARSNRTGRPFALVFFDLNGLKAINDRDGHIVGNRALSRVAVALSRSCRVIDTPARFGGDEFAVVLPESGEEGGDLVGARVASALAAEAAKPEVSVSSGTAVYPRDGENPTMLMRAADQALYRAKAGLRGRVSPEPAEDSAPERWTAAG